MEDALRIAIRRAEAPEDLADARRLFRAYVDGLGVDLSFQGVADEIAGLPGAYAPPAGALLLARDEGGAALGCVAVRPLGQDGVCEMKRLYVVPEARGMFLGRALVEAIVAFARAAGHRRMVLDTLAGMDDARKLYAAMGFAPSAPHYDNPLPGTAYLALDL